MSPNATHSRRGNLSGWPKHDTHEYRPEDVAQPKEIDKALKRTFGPFDEAQNKEVDKTFQMIMREKSEGLGGGAGV